MKFEAAGLPPPSNSIPQPASSPARRLPGWRPQGDAARLELSWQGFTRVPPHRRRHYRAHAPMGWNHWYTHYARISDKLFREARGRHGLVRHG